VRRLLLLLGARQRDGACRATRTALLRSLRCSLLSSLLTLSWAATLCCGGAQHKVAVQGL
jgi:hypothetical protein